MKTALPTIEVTPIPDDLASLQDMVKAQNLLIQKLMIQLAAQRRHRFGTRSEGLDQLGLGLDETEVRSSQADACVRGEPDEAEDCPPAPKRKPKRNALPPELPRDRQTFAPASTDCCGKAMRKMAEDIREILDYLPASFFVRQQVIEKFSCRDCGTIVEGEPPENPIAKGAAGSGLLAHILVSKYADALPLYRQSAIYARQDIDLSRSTMSGWVLKMAELLAPLAGRIEAHVLAGEAIHTDDTVVPVMAPGLKRTKKGRLWAHVRDEQPWGSAIPPAVFYKYSPNRKGEHPQTHLKTYEGFLHVDGFTGYDRLFAKGKVKEVGCMAHIRRKFVDIYDATFSPIAEKALKWIAELYRIEREISGQSAHARKAVRQEKARPIFEALFDWLGATKPTLPVGQPLAKAVSYALTQMTKLERYLDDGRLAIDNNASERAVKNIVLGRKNFLFFGSDAGGDNAAIIYTLIETAKLNKINSEAWLTHVIQTIGDCKQTQLDHLLPWNWPPAE